MLCLWLIWIDTTDEILAELREVVSAANREGKEGKGSSNSSALQTNANANANANNGKSSSSSSASIASLDRSALNAVDDKIEQSARSAAHLKGYDCITKLSLG
jgi:hypothetical protein